MRSRLIGGCRHRRHCSMRRLLLLAAVWLYGSIVLVLGDRILRPSVNQSEIEQRLSPLAFAQHLEALKESTADQLRSALKHTFSSKVDSVDPIEETFSTILEGLARGRDLVPCEWDTTIPASIAGVTGLLHAGPVFIAANLYNNEELMPHFITQLLHLIVLLPPHTAYLSVYESNSNDDTGAWLEVLRALMEALSIPHRIIAGDMVPRSEGSRIPFLAAARNKALEPMWLPAEGPAHGEHSAHRARTGGSASSGAAGWPPKRVVFINDVFFCARDAVRLLLHKADMACGLDFVLYPDMTWANFYDNWVSRDIDGRLFTVGFPHVTDPYSVQRMERGLHFPVKCCWNGMAVMSAAPFLRHGVRVRANEPGECAASECSLLCNDFLRLGFDRIVVDPGVRMTYEPFAAQNVYTGLNELNLSYVKVPMTRWREIQANPIDKSMTTMRPMIRCCGMAEETGRVAWNDGEEAVCTWDNYLVPNYTATAFAPHGATADVQRHHRKQAAHTV